MGVRELVAWAGDRPVFTVNEVERGLGMERESLRVLLHRAVEQNAVRRIERGVYTVQDDVQVYATRIETPSYMSLWSGLRWYDLTTQLPGAVQVMVGRSRPDVDQVRFYRTQHMFGFTKEQYKGFDVFVAEPEKLLIDCVSRREVSVSALDELVRTVDIETVTAYCRETGVNAVCKRVGYLLEVVRDTVVEDLEQYVDHNTTKLDLSRPTAGRRHERWNVVVNADVA